MPLQLWPLSPSSLSNLHSQPAKLFALADRATGFIILSVLSSPLPPCCILTAKTCHPLASPQLCRLGFTHHWLLGNMQGREGSRKGPPELGSLPTGSMALSVCTAPVHTSQCSKELLLQSCRVGGGCGEKRNEWDKEHLISNKKYLHRENHENKPSLEFTQNQKPQTSRWLCHEPARWAKLSLTSSAVFAAQKWLQTTRN